MYTEEEKQAIRDKYDVRELYPVSAERKSYPNYAHEHCIFSENHKNGDQNKSMLVYQDGFVCKGCGARGDCFALVMRLDGCNFPQAYEKLAGGNIKLVAPQVAIVKRSPAPVPLGDLFTTKEIDVYAANMGANDYVCLEQRTRIKRVTAVSHHIGKYDEGTFTIPIYNPNAELVDVKCYRPKSETTTKAIWHLRSGGTNTLYGLSLIAHLPNDFVVIVGGEKDTILGHQDGLPFVTVTSGEMAWTRDFNRYLNRFQKVYVWLDADDAGRGGMEKVRKLMPRVILCDWRFLWSANVKDGYDYDDYKKDGGTTTTFLQMLKRAEKGLRATLPILDEPF